MVADFGGGSVFGQSCLKITGRHRVLCCNPLHWIVWVAFGTLPLSIGRVDGATGQAYGKAVPSLAIPIGSLTRPIFTRELVFIALTALEHGIGAHGGRTGLGGAEFQLSKQTAAEVCTFFCRWHH